MQMFLILCIVYIFQKMINGGTVHNWTCLNFSRMRPEEVQRFCVDLIHMCNAAGMVKFFTNF
jgi:eukaryotic translation initiation factor 2C